jgi:hypothetical protein
MVGLPDRLPHTFGKDKTKLKYSICTIFLDDNMVFAHHHHQSPEHVGETLNGKNTFEKESAQFDVNNKKCNADNEPFSPIEFCNNIENKEQDLTFLGVSAHHQTGMTE